MASQVRAAAYVGAFGAAGSTFSTGGVALATHDPDLIALTVAGSLIATLLTSLLTYGVSRLHAERDVNIATVEAERDVRIAEIQAARDVDVAKTQETATVEVERLHLEPDRLRARSEATRTERHDQMADALLKGNTVTLSAAEADALRHVLAQGAAGS